MGLSDNATRFLSTLVIWAASAMIFVFGFTKMNADGFGVLFYGFIGLGLALSPAIATAAVWKSNGSVKMIENKPDATTLSHPQPAHRE